MVCGRLVASKPLCRNYFGIRRSTVRIADDERQNRSTREEARVPHNACATCGTPLFRVSGSTVDLAWIWSSREYAAGLHDHSFKAVAKNMSPVVFDEYKTDTQHKKSRKRQADKPSEPECREPSAATHASYIGVRLHDRPACVGAGPKISSHIMAFGKTWCVTTCLIKGKGSDIKWAGGKGQNLWVEVIQNTKLPKQGEPWRPGVVTGGFFGKIPLNFPPRPLHSSVGAASVTPNRTRKWQSSRSLYKMRRWAAVELLKVRQKHF